MSHWIDDVPPYPWHLALARDLHKRLVDTFYEPSEIRDLIRVAGGPNHTLIAFTGRGPHQIWVDVLDRAAADGSLRPLLVYIVAQGNITKAFAAFVQDLLDAKEPPANPAPGGKDGPGFASDVTQEEALLFGEDLSESVGEIPDLLAAVDRVMKWRGAVCHLRVTGPGGGVWEGTGTLLTGNRILTNHHVLFPGGQKATAVAVEFNYEMDAAGQKLASTIVQGDVATIKSDPADDWGVISVTPPAGIIPIDLVTNVATAQVTQRALILQHPLGKPKRLAFVRNRVSSVENRRVYYLTDTEGGSSGSPVFNAQGQLIALHRAGGTPQKLIGLEPVKKNEGVRMDVIVANIANA